MKSKPVLNIFRRYTRKLSSHTSENQLINRFASIFPLHASSADLHSTIPISFVWNLHLTTSIIPSRPVTMTKRTFLFAVLTVFGTMIAVSQAEDPAVAKAFTDNEIVPDVLSKAPGALVKVSYASSGAEVNLGNELTPTQVKDEPSVSWEAEPGALYTLVMTDPDAPTRAEPKMREWKHWVVINVPGSDVAAGETVAEYIGSAPPQDSGLHRYVFLVYKQSRGRMRWCEPKLSNR